MPVGFVSPSISRWSCDSPAPVLPEGSEGEEQFTLSYMSKQLREQTSPSEFTSLVQPCRQVLSPPGLRRCESLSARFCPPGVSVSCLCI